MWAARSGSALEQSFRAITGEAEVLFVCIVPGASSSKSTCDKKPLVLMLVFSLEQTALRQSWIHFRHLV